MRLVEIRPLDGPNIYRLEPAVRIEVTVGRRRTWYGQRNPGRHAVVRLGATVPASQAPRSVGDLARWVRRLHRRALGVRVQVTLHRTSEPGHWVVVYPWTERQKAETIARAALRLVEQPQNQVFERAVRRVSGAGGGAPDWIRDTERHVPLISISGTNGKSTTTRMLTHIAHVAGVRVGTTTTDGVMVDERIVEPGDFTGPQGARHVLGHPDVELAVLETARGGILLRGLGYESNDASVLTNVSADHLDLQGLHTLPELAEVKSVICRVTRRKGAVVLNADDPLVAAVARRVKAPVYLFSVRPGNARVRRHLAAGGRAFVADEGWLMEMVGSRRKRIVEVSAVPSTLGGLARHNVANALAAAGAGRALGFDHDAIAAGLRDFRTTPDLMPARLNLYLRDNRLVIVDYAHNEAGLEVLLDTAEALLGGDPYGRRRKRRREGTLSVIVGTAGDRPDDGLRAVGRAAAARADEVAIKESLTFLRGRSRAGVIGELKEGMRAAGLTPSNVPVYENEPEAIRGELTDKGRLAGTKDGTRRIIALMCHAQREEVEAVLRDLRFKPLDSISDWVDLRD